MNYVHVLSALDQITYQILRTTLGEKDYDSSHFIDEEIEVHHVSSKFPGEMLVEWIHFLCADYGAPCHIHPGVAESHLAM